MDGSLIGGGGSPPLRELLSGNTVTINAGAQGSLTWDSKDLGDDLLDLSAPANPTAINGGKYALTVTTGCDADLTVSAFYTLFVQMDASGDDAQAFTPSVSAAAPPFGRPDACISLTYYVPAGGVINVAVVNHDSVPRGYYIRNAVLQFLG